MSELQEIDKEFDVVHALRQKLELQESIIIAQAKTLSHYTDVLGSYGYWAPKPPSVMYIHDEWCKLWGEDCGCYVGLLEQKDKRIAQLEEEVERLSSYMYFVPRKPSQEVSDE